MEEEEEEEEEKKDCEALTKEVDAVNCESEDMPTFIANAPGRKKRAAKFEEKREGKEAVAMKKKDACKSLPSPKSTKVAAVEAVADAANQQQPSYKLKLD